MVQYAAAFSLLDRISISFNTAIGDKLTYVRCVHHHNIHTHMPLTVIEFVPSELPCTNGFRQVRVAEQ